MIPTDPAPDHPSMRDPLAAAALRPDQAVLAVITDVIGASYRRPGAMMALFQDGSFAGGLTNGCIEGDLALHAATCLATGQVAHLHYGEGSRFFDIRLPCGGGLKVALYPRPDAAVLREITRLRARRGFFALRLAPSGQLAITESQPTGWSAGDFLIDLPPEPGFAIFGEGPETVVFARLVQSCGYPHRVVTPSSETFDALIQSGCTALLAPGAPEVSADARTAVVTFFHDHDRELPILIEALRGPAFYVGAQGSRRVAESRAAALRAAGVEPSALARLHAPIGLIPSARDPKTLAISVLAEIIRLSAT